MKLLVCGNPVSSPLIILLISFPCSSFCFHYRELVPNVRLGNKLYLYNLNLASFQDKNQAQAWSSQTYAYRKLTLSSNTTLDFNIPVQSIKFFVKTYDVTLFMLVKSKLILILSSIILLDCRLKRPDFKSGDIKWNSLSLNNGDLILWKKHGGGRERWDLSILIIQLAFSTSGIIVCILFLKFNNSFIFLYYSRERYVKTKSSIPQQASAPSSSKYSVAQRERERRSSSLILHCHLPTKLNQRK